MPAFPVPPAPAAASKTPSQRSWSVGTILLVLGAVGLVVAGLIFVTRSWDDLGLTGRTLILVAVTAVIGGLGAWVTARPLRASAEAVWSVFVALLTLDFFAAHHEDLLGLRSLSYPGTYLVWGIALLAVSVAIGLWARPRVKVALVSMAVAGGVGIAMGGLGAGGAPGDIDFAWRACIALMAAGLLALATRPAALAPLTLVARIVFALFFVFAYLAAVVELIEYPYVDDLLGGGHGAPMLLMVIASLVAAWLVPAVRMGLTACAVLGLAALIVTPAAAAQDEKGWAAVAVIAVVAAVAGVRGVDAWARGVRIGAIALVGALVILHVMLLDVVGTTAGLTIRDAWEGAWTDRLGEANVGYFDGWLPPIAAVALMVTAWCVTRWPEARGMRRYATLVVAVTVAVGVLNAVVNMRPAAWVVAATLLALAVVGVVLMLRAAMTLLGPVILGAVLAASLFAGASQGVSAWTWLGGAVVLAVLVPVDRLPVLAEIHAGVGSLLLVAGVSACVDLAGADHAVTSLVAVVVALGLVAVAGIGLTEHAARLPVEVAGGGAVLIGLMTYGSSGELAVRWTVAGVILIALSFVLSSRRAYVWPGLAALIVAYTLLIIDAGFSFVEAYTLPLGVAALGVGLYLARRSPPVSSWVFLGPGLAISMLPSLPQALAGPTDLRALLLGVGALAVLAVGVKLQWQAPFVVAVSVLILLVLFNIGPYANAAPRVVVIAVASAILLGIGITWEDRVRDGRKIAAYLRSMR